MMRIFKGIKYCMMNDTQLRQCIEIYGLYELVLRIHKVSIRYTSECVCSQWKILSSHLKVLIIASADYVIQHTVQPATRLSLFHLFSTCVLIAYKNEWIAIDLRSVCFVLLFCRCKKKNQNRKIVWTLIPFKWEFLIVGVK